MVQEAQTPRKRFHVVQVSDLHLSPDRAYNQNGWEQCISYIASEHPDLVISTGDHVLDDPDCLDDHEFAHRQLSRLNVPWLAVPGNHDVGDLNPHPYFGQHVDEERLARYCRLFGPDRWRRDLGDWLLIGINAFLLGSDFDREAEQEEWLREIVREAKSRPIALFLHKPLCVTHLSEASTPDICVIADGRQRLLAVLKGTNLRLVASGHTHHYRSLMIGSTAMVWAPSTAQILSMDRPFRALMRPGVVHYWLEEGGELEFGHAEPPGLRPTDITAVLQKHGAMRTAPKLAFQPQSQLELL